MISKMMLVFVLLVLLGIDQGVEARPAAAAVEQFKARLKQKLQKYEEGSCIKAMHDYLFTAYGDFQQQMWLQSLHGINDVSGDQMTICNSLKQNMTVPAEDLSWDTSYSVINLNVSSMPVKIRFGVCLPSSCTQEDLLDVGNRTSKALSAALKAVLDSKYNPQIQFIPDWTEAQISLVKTQEFVDDYWLNLPYFRYGAAAVSVSCAAIVLVILYASISKIWNDNAGQPTNGRLVSISLQKSFHDLLAPREVDTSIFGDKTDLKMLDFFRVLCLIWILAFGTCQFTMSGSAYNPWTLQDYFKTIAYTIVYSANLGFDEFFMLSSFFAYVQITNYFKYSARVPEKMGEFDYYRIYAHRFMRLAPVYYIVFLFGWLVGPYLNSGPWWFTYQMGFCDCQHYWWSVFTMTINFFPSYVVANEGCFYWGWFTACEMQLFLVIPLLVYILEFRLKARKRAQVLVLLAVLALGTYINYHVIYVNNMAAGLFAPQDIAIYKLWLNKPYTKLHSVALGMLLAQLFLAVNEAKRDGKFEAYLSNSIFRSGWVALFACLASFGLLAFLSTYPRSANNDPASWSREKSAIFVSLSRPAFLVSLMCLFYLLWLGYAPGVKRFFSRRMWAVPARLSYGVYLVFPITSAQFNSSMDAALYLTYNEMFFQLIFNMLCALVAALVVHVLIEAPLRNLLAGRTEIKRSPRVAKLTLHAASLESEGESRAASMAPRPPHLQSTSTAFASERETLASIASAPGSRDQTLDAAHHGLL